MTGPRRSPLFSAVVLAGVSLTGGVAGCGDDASPPPGDGGATETSALTDTSILTDATGADTTADSANIDAAIDTTDAGDAEQCPPDSERPTPPCSFIK